MSGYPWLCILVGGPTIKMKTARGVVAFEWHDYCGPMPITLKRGHEGTGRNLPPNHPFWDKVTRWCEQGRIVRDGWAIVERRAAPDAPAGEPER